ncbi:hypothetical protein Hypma_014391 [Hypsizygus marmoreus]|uniref:F-box domain-containing protein n=1 Tax=Hypsizygus marmoreus TaxID=39966 RepID=A0A369JCE6_HYPMA|nr:hypothetical protein Hypma_014391 [Hypsizygus marmoreus]
MTIDDHWGFVTWVPIDILEAINSATTHNEVIPEELTPHISALIAEINGQISLIEDEVALGHSLSHQQLDAYTTLRRQYQTLSAPQRKVPHDVLSEIFSHFRDYPITIPLNEQQPLICASHVSSKWRRVAQSTAMLWKDIILYANGQTRDLTSRVEMAEEVFRRTGHMKLSLTINIDSNFRGIGIAKLTNLIITHASRLEQLTLPGRVALTRAFYSLPPGSVESLRSLTIAMSSKNPPSAASVFQGAKSLRMLKINIGMPVSPFILEIPFRQLTHLDAYCDAGLAFDILTQCRALERCTLSVTAYGSPASSNDLTLGSLKVLDLAFRGRIQRAPHHVWLRQLRLPALLCFTLSLDESGAWQPTWTLALARWGPLEEVTVLGRIESLDIDQIIASCPSLVHLDVQSAQGIPQSTYAKMATGEYAPRLQTLSCAVRSTDGLAPLMDMLEARRQESNVVSHISEVVIEDAVPFEAIDLARLKRLVYEGWDIRFA